MLRYSWHGVEPMRPDEIREGMMNVRSLQFDFNMDRGCEVPDCNHAGFIQRAHCGKVLCLEHFLNRTCFHEIQEHHDHHEHEEYRGAAVDNLSELDELDDDMAELPPNHFNPPIRNQVNHSADNTIAADNTFTQPARRLFYPLPIDAIGTLQHPGR